MIFSRLIASNASIYSDFVQK